MKRFQRISAAAVAVALAGAGLTVATATAASAAVLGTVNLTSPGGFNVNTVFTLSVPNANCPAGTSGAYFQIDGPDLPPGDLVAPSTNEEGTGPQSVPYAIANIRTTNAGSFSTTGTYNLSFNCPDLFGVITDSYTGSINFDNTTGTYTVNVPVVEAVNTGTVLTASPAGPVEQGTAVTLSADVTPASGPDAPVGTVEFFSGATSLGAGSALTGTGVSTLTTGALPAGTNSITAVFTPGAGFNTSTSTAVSYVVSPVAARPTTTVLTVTPVDGPAFSQVTLTCDVDAGAFEANGTARFLDGSNVLGSVPVTAGAPAVFTTSNIGAGARNLTCQFVGAAPYTDSVSVAVAVAFTQAGAEPDEQTVIVEIPVGVITITTPYTPANPLSLGVAVLDPSDSTYSASAQFGTDAATTIPGVGGAAGIPGAFITITDSRSGNLGFTASLVAGAFSNGTSSFGGEYAGLTAVTANQIAGNAMLASQVTETDTVPNVGGGLGSPKVFAAYPAGQPLGSVNLTGLFGIDGVPTSVTPGVYTSTVTFTAV